MATPQPPGASVKRIQNKQLPVRRSLSCLPCRSHKLKCNRGIPCDSCIRRGREEECRLHPAPSAALNLASRANRQQRLSQSTNQRPSTDSSNDPEFSSADAHVRRSSHASFSSLPNSGQLNPSTPSLSLPSPATSSGSGNDESGDRRMPNIATSLPSQVSLPWIAPSAKLSERNEHVQGWRHYFVSQVPSRFQCDMLVAYYFEHIGWIYQTIHVPSFRAEYSSYWASDKQDADLIWLSLLFILLAVAGLQIPAQMKDVISIEATATRVTSERWFHLSRQALQAGGFESKPSLTALQTFVVSQLYLYATRDVEMLNSFLGQAVRNAQALGLDKPSTKYEGLKQEMRHRIWWDICASDTSQSVTLNRQPLIASHLSTIAEPLNCNDTDLSPTSVSARPMYEPTVMSVNICRNKVLRLMNKLYRDNGASLNSYDFISGVDLEVSLALQQCPTYAQVVNDKACTELSPELECIYWQYNVIQTFVCLQRIRMYRPFLRSQEGDSLRRCIDSAESAFTVYMNMRQKSKGFQRSQKFRAQVYQSFQAGVCLAMFLLVERPAQWNKIRADLETVVCDLEMLAEETVPIAYQGRVILRQILNMYDNKGQVRAVRSANLVPEIQAVFGGEEATREYLESHPIGSSPEVETQHRHNGLEVQQQTIDTGEHNLSAQFHIADAGDYLQPLGENSNFDPFDIPIDLLDWPEWDAFLLESYTQFG